MQMVDEGVNDIDMMGLSSREMEIIDLVADGLTNQEIAVKLTISKRTVDNHVSNMFTKTGSKNRVALLNWAMDNGRFVEMDLIVVHFQTLIKSSFSIYFFKYKENIKDQWLL